PDKLSASQPNLLPFVSIVVVNFNGERFLDECLDSLEKQSYPRERRELIVVDNGSSDGSARKIREQFARVRLVSMPTNLGFAQGTNEGIRAAHGDLIALVNNDTSADPRWLEALVEEIGRHPTAGGVTSKILFKDEPGIINSAGLNLYRDGRGGDRG